MNRTIPSDQDLEELERLAKSATPGPWVALIEHRDIESGSSFIRTAADDIEPIGASAADMDFMAMARNLMPALIAEIRTARNAKHRQE